MLIEGDDSRVRQLHKNFASDDVIKVHRFVSFSGDNSLDSIYSETPIPTNFDFLSIDVDGVDYHIFQSLVKYRPKVICIEFNPAIPNSVDYVQPKDMRIKHGNSGKAILRLAHKKGYVLVTGTPCNLFLVDNRLSKFVVEKEPKLESINPMGNSEIVIFPGYDGSILSDKEKITLGWHGVLVSISENLQFLPKFLRRFKGDYGLFRNLFFIIYVGFRVSKQIYLRPSDALKKLTYELRNIFKI